MKSFSSFIPALIILMVGVLILYNKNKVKFKDKTTGQKIERLGLYAIYMFLGMIAFTIVSILIDKLRK